MLNWFCMISIQGREHYSGDFIRYTFDIGPHLYTYELMCFKLSLKLHKTKLQYDSNFNDFDLHWRSLVYGRCRNWCSHSVVKWHEVTQAFVIVDCVREMTSKTLSMVTMDQLRICWFLLSNRDKRPNLSWVADVCPPPPQTERKKSNEMKGEQVCSWLLGWTVMLACCEKGEASNGLKLNIYGRALQGWDLPSVSNWPAGPEPRQAEVAGPLSAAQLNVVITNFADCWFHILLPFLGSRKTRNHNIHKKRKLEV